MAFNYLPNEIKENIFLYAGDYTPALKMVSKLWREIISYRRFNKRISFKDLVRRGDVDILIDLHKRKKKGHNCSLLIYAAFYGREELCHLAKRWGESNFEGMLYAARKGGHKNICQIAKAWGAEGIDDLPYGFSVESGYESLSPFSYFCDASYLEEVYFYVDNYVRYIIREWGLNDPNLLFSVQNNSKGGNTYITINEWVGARGRRKRIRDSKPKDLWCDRGAIIVRY